MTAHEIVDYLRSLAESCASVAGTGHHSPRLKARLNMQASVMLEAADTILQLQDRLVRQACYFEHIEAAAQPKTWPLLEDDDCDDAGAAL